MGLEVETVCAAAPLFENIVVGEVIKTEKHPSADRLTLCKVDVSDEVLEIVCGAPNVRTGLKVAVARVGGLLPNGIRIQPVKIRGASSSGMLCSEVELGLSEEKNGILELPQDAPLGKDLRAYLNLNNDHLMDVSVTPNRGDCLSIRGIAREVHAFTQAPIRVPYILPQKTAISETLPVNVHASEACPRYVGRVIRNINLHAETPLEIREQLRRSGMRSIHPVVDVLNWVMLELGQPMHAFDLDRVQESIHVRFAHAGESVQLLDEQEVTLYKEDLVIADPHKVLAIAGVMGGLHSAVSENTHHIFLESAFFTPERISKVSRRLNVQTQSSHRFERGVDFEIPRLALERASQLLQEIVGGEMGPIIEKVHFETLPQRKSISLRRERISRILGISVTDDFVISTLTHLDMKVQTDTAGFEVTPPSFRFDITMEDDLIEEIARLYGYKKIPSTMGLLKGSIPSVSETSFSPQSMRRLFVDRGYHEIITYSFVNKELQKQLNPDVSPVELANPMSHDMNVMRTNLWPGLLSVLLYNQHRQIGRMKFFELGKCFLAEGECLKLGGVITGFAHTQQWGIAHRLFDFYDLKGDISCLLSNIKPTGLAFVPTTHPALHPGQTAEIRHEGHCIGIMGALHPQLVQQFELVDVPYFFELDVDLIKLCPLPHHRPLSKFPMIRRDIAVVVNEDLPASELINAITRVSGKLLNNVWIFDIYSGEGIEFGKKSVALGLTFQDPSRTLKDEEVNKIVERVIGEVQRQFHATLRA